MGIYHGDTDQARVTAKIDRPMLGHNLASHLDALRTAMRKAAENLEFEEAARLRDEVKRLEAVELAVADDPLAVSYTHLDVYKRQAHQRINLACRCRGEFQHPTGRLGRPRLHGGLGGLINPGAHG